MRKTPPRYFSLSPCDARKPLHKQRLHDTLVCEEQLEARCERAGFHHTQTQTRRTYLHTHRIEHACTSSSETRATVNVVKDESQIKTNSNTVPTPLRRRGRSKKCPSIHACGETRPRCTSRCSAGAGQITDEAPVNRKHIM